MLGCIFLGYTDVEARIGLRSCANNIDQAIGFIHDRRNRLKNARKQGRAERKAKNSLAKTTNSNWINPRTLNTLVDMGFDNNLCALALQKTDNDINKAVNISTFNIFITNVRIIHLKFITQILLLQNRNSELQEEFTKSIKPDENLCDQIAMMGFDMELIKSMLKETSNDVHKTIETLLKMQNDGTYENKLKELVSNLLTTDPSNSRTNPSIPSTSRITENIRERIAEQAEEAKVPLFSLFERRKDTLSF